MTSIWRVHQAYYPGLEIKLNKLQSDGHTIMEVHQGHDKDTWVILTTVGVNPPPVLKPVKATPPNKDVRVKPRRKKKSKRK